MKKLTLVAAIMILAVGTPRAQTTLTLSDDSLTTATGAYQSAVQAYPYKWDITKGDVILQGIIDLGGIQAHVNTWDPDLGDPDDFFGLWGQIGLSKDPVFNSSDGVWFVTVEWLGGGDDSLTEIREILHMQEEPGTQPMPKLYTEPRTIAGGDGDDTLTFELQIHSTGATTGWAKLWIHGVLIEGDMWSVFDPDSLDFTGEDLSNAHVLVGVISGNNPNNPAHTFYWSNLTVTGYPASYSEVWVDSTWVGTAPGTEVEPGKYFGFNAFAEIQDGIDAVAVGGTVYVAAGTYHEQVIVDKALTLNGANAGIPGYGTRVAESIVDADDPDEPTWVAAFFIESGDVTIDGFKTIDADEGVHVACDQPTWGDRENVVIKNNYIDTQEGEPQTSIAATGIAFYSLNTAYSVDGAVVQDNYINQYHNKDAIWFQDVHGSSITIKENKIDATSSSASGIILGATSSLGSYVDLSGTVIMDNEADMGAGGIGIQLKRFTSPTTPVSITGNILTGGSFGIRMWEGDANTNVVAHYNNVAGNAWGIQVRSDKPWSTVVDATDNWWGTVNGPEHSGNTYNVGSQGPQASYYVTYVPWWDAYPSGSSWGPVENLSASYYSSIQAAVDAASSGHTITCAAGTYNEAETFLDHAGLNFDATRSGITLSGANAGIPGYGTRGAESIIEGPNVLHGNAIYIFDGADGVIIDGFTLKAGDDIVENRADEVVIKNNIITPVSGTPADPNAPGIFACECDNFTASYNWILDIGPDGGCGMFLGLASFFADITNSLIAHNLIESSGGAGILINYASGTGINTVEYNEIKNVGHDGIRAGGEAHGTTIEHNEIYGSARDGVRIMADAASHHINYNSIYSSVAYGVNNLDAATVDASGNWLGDNTPSGVAAQVSGNVDYTPWLDSGTDTDPGPGFQGDFSVLDVDDDSPQTGSTGRIQEGVNLVTGSTVNVAAGTYEEQVVIGKELTLVGAGKDVTVIQSPTTLTEYFTTSAKNYPIVYLHDADVTINGFTIDGLGRGNANYRFTGIGFWNAGGSITNVNLTGVRDTPFSGSQHGVAIYAYNNTGGPYTIDLSGVIIDDFQKNGTALNGDGLTANLSNCTVTGHGLTNMTAQNGIQIGFGAGGTVTDCSVSDIAYDDTTWAASGILFYQATSVDVSGTCSVTNSQSGIVFRETNGSVDGATVSASNANNKEEGISVREYGETKASGSGLSIAAASPLAEEWQYQHRRSSATTTVTLSELNLTGANQELSYGIGVWAIGDDVNVTITNSTIQDWGIGVVAKDSVGSVTVVADSNTISSNDFGVWTNAASAQDFENNNWGTSDGPEDPDGTAEVYIGQCFSVDSMMNTVAELFPAEGLGNGVSDNVDYCPWIPWSCCVVRGDVDHGGDINVVDLIYLVDYIFFEGPAPPCFEEGDVDGVTAINVVDLIYLVDYIFFAGPPPPPC